MKTIKNFIPIFILTAFFLTGSIYAHNENVQINQTEESYTLNEEATVDDIPFDTNALATEIIYQQATSIHFPLKEELYVNDIPFDTRSIACTAACQKAMSVNFPLEEEAYIDDIPFNTALIVAVIKAYSVNYAQRKFN